MFAIDRITSILQLLDVQNVRKDTRSVLTKLTRNSSTLLKMAVSLTFCMVSCLIVSIPDLCPLSNFGGFIHIFNLFVY